MPQLALSQPFEPDHASTCLYVSYQRHNCFVLPLEPALFPNL